MIAALLAGVAGFIIGGLICAVCCMHRQAQLMRRNAELETLVIAEKAALDRAGAELDTRFRATAHDVLAQNSEQFLARAEEKLKAAGKDGAHDLATRQKAIETLIEPIGKTLTDMTAKVETLGKAGAGLESSLRNFAEDQRLLRQETQNLVAALRNNKARGRWGEMQLQRALEMVGMVEGMHFRQQVEITGGETKAFPDFIVMLPGGLEIIIDVKTPLDPYWQTLEAAETEGEREQAIRTFQQNVRNHLKTLKAREYWRHRDGSPAFVVMFLPTEGLYSLAISGDPDLLEDAANMQVILASPTTLMGLLRVAMHGWQQQKLAEEARTIANLGAELYKRVGTFGDYMASVGNGLNSAITAYNKAVGSLESRVLPTMRKFKDHQVQTGGDDVVALSQSEKLAQMPVAAELFAARIPDTEILVETLAEPEKKIA